jgi:hypothetical protein
VDVQGLQVAGRGPADIAGLVVDRRRAADRAAEEDQLPLLPDLAIGVGDDVAWVGVDTTRPMSSDLLAEPGLGRVPHPLEAAGAAADVDDADAS